MLRRQTDRWWAGRRNGERKGGWISAAGWVLSRSHKDQRKPLFPWSTLMAWAVEEPEWPPFRAFWGNTAAAPLGSPQVFQLLWSLLLRQLRKKPHTAATAPPCCVWDLVALRPVRQGRSFCQETNVLFEDLVVPEAPPGGTRAFRHQGPRERTATERGSPRSRRCAPLQQPPPARPQRRRSGRLCWLI